MQDLNNQYQQKEASLKFPEINDDCVGCGSCVELCPEVFQMQGEKAVVLNPNNCTICDCESAADICPVQAISMKDS